MVHEPRNAEHGTRSIDAEYKRIAKRNTTQNLNTKRPAVCKNTMKHISKHGTLCKNAVKRVVRSMEQGKRSTNAWGIDAEHKHGALSMEHGVRSTEHGAQSTEHGA